MVTYNFQQSKIDRLNYELNQTEDILINLLGYLEENDYYDDDELEWECNEIADRIDQISPIDSDEDPMDEEEV